MKNYKIFQLVLILTPFVFSFAFGLDIYIPIVPQMAKLFDTSTSMVHLTLSLFLFATGAGQLFIGPLADQYGRKTIFYCSAACYALGSIGCALSPTIFWLIMARLLCSLGACGMLVTSYALIRDLFSNDESGVMYSFLNGAIGISPTFAPIIGGYLAVYFGWQSVFFFLALIGFVALFVTNLCIKETLPSHERVKVNKEIFGRYLRIIRNRQFIIYATISGLAESVFFCFFSISPFIIINLLGVPTHEFGYYFAVFGSVIALGGFGSGKLIEKVGISATMVVGIGLMFTGGASMLVWSYLAAISLQSFLIPMAVACTGAMFLVGCCAARSLEPFGEIAGTASAAYGAIQFSLSAAAGSLLMLFPVTSTTPYAISIVLMAALSLWLYRLHKPVLISSV